MSCYNLVMKWRATKYRIYLCYSRLINRLNNFLCGRPTHVLTMLHLTHPPNNNQTIYMCGSYITYLHSRNLKTRNIEKVSNNCNIYFETISRPYIILITEIYTTQNMVMKYHHQVNFKSTGKHTKYSNVNHHSLSTGYTCISYS